MSQEQLQAALAARERISKLLAPNPFADDDGSTPAALAAALSAQLPRPQFLRELVAAIAATRLIVPVPAHGLEEPAAAVAVEIGKPGGHKPHQNDPAQDAASLALHLDDGHIAMPVFSSQADMQAWRTDVRPAPVTPQRAAQVACLSTDQIWVLNPATDNIRIPRPAVISLSQAQKWVPSWENEQLQAELKEQLMAYKAMVNVAFEAGDTSELRIYALIDRSCGKEEMLDAVEGAQQVLVNPDWANRVDHVEICPILWPIEQ